MNSKDLFFIHCALNQISVDPTPFLLSHLISVANRVTGSICVGGIITAIANALELEPALELADTLPCLFVDLDFCKNMRLVKTLPNGKYHVMIRTREILDFTLPNPSRINVRVSANWLFDAVAQDLDQENADMDQAAPQPRSRSHASDAPGPNTAPHTAPMYSDFTGMRTTLDEVLSELRAQRESQDERDKDMHDLRRRQLEFMERTQLDMRDIVSGMAELRGDV